MATKTSAGVRAGPVWAEPCNYTYEILAVKFTLELRRKVGHAFNRREALQKNLVWTLHIWFRTLEKPSFFLPHCYLYYFSSKKKKKSYEDISLKLWQPKIVPSPFDTAKQAVREKIKMRKQKKHDHKLIVMKTRCF